ncbi:CENP-S associating centromere protein X-domain-containing protein [Xylaria arbuscula]|nr:CENP-S associating centromere protein X-domain-containing protein [Xylaria arbuscula]
MPPKHSSTGSSRGSRADVTSKKAPARPQTHTSQSRKTAYPSHSDDPFAEDDDMSRKRRNDGIDFERDEHGAEVIDTDEEEAEPKKTIPPELLTRILHEFFEKDGTRISKDANKAVAKYIDIFVREAIARTAVEKGTGFLEVEDLEKVAPQLLMDL